MSACSGLHCAGCGSGSAVPVAALAAIFGADWVLENLVAVLVVSAVCGLLALAGVVALMRWAERRDARPVQLWTDRRAQVPAAVTATVIPQAVTGARPAAIENHLHIHHHYAGPEPARVRTAITGQAGDAITEGE